MTESRPTHVVRSPACCVSPFVEALEPAPIEVGKLSATG